MRLSELIDIGGVQKLAEANFAVNGMPLGIIDARDGGVLVAVGWQEICTRFHRIHPESAKRCRESDDFIKAHLSPTAQAWARKRGIARVLLSLSHSGPFAVAQAIGVGA